MSDFEVISIVGPTAVGKTSLALKMAAEIPAEIVSLDAYQIYRGMDIGTAKARPTEQELVKHHLIDVVDIDFAATISDFHKWAVAAITEINKQGKTAICVGGSGLYVQSVLEVLDIPPTDSAVREKYSEMATELGEIALHELLQKIDPRAAANIEVSNVRRVIRALEVNELTGQNFNAVLKPNPPRYRDLRIGLEIPRAELNVRIAERVNQMLKMGWEAEVEQLVSRGLLETPTASKAIGYREIASALAGDIEIEEAVAQTVKATTRFGKRQVSWFRRDSKVKWINPSDFRFSALI